MSRFWIAVFFVAACASITRAESIVDQPFGFSMIVPDGFAACPEFRATSPNFIYAFRKPGAPGDEIGTVIIIERLGGTIGPEPVDMAHMPPGFKGRLLTVPWHAFNIQAFEVPETADDVALMNYNAQIPLKRGAIQLRVTGLAARAPELRQLFDTTLANLDGESNWLTSIAPPSLANSPHYGLINVAVIAVGVVIGLICLWFVGRRISRGMIIALAILIYASSFLIDAGRVRELHGFRGGIRLLGFIGMILGIVDLIWPRRAKPPVTTRQ